MLKGRMSDRLVAAVILAAGGASRFGSAKQLAIVGEHSLCQLAINTARKVFQEDVYLVLGANRQSIQDQITGAHIIPNGHWREGIGTSIAVGVANLGDQFEGVMILLADQPDIQPAHLQGMIAKFTGSNIVAAYYRDKRGVPALFPKDCFPALSQLKGDQGAKQLLHSSNKSVTEYPLNEAAFDIDTPKNLREWKARLQNRLITLPVGI